MSLDTTMKVLPLLCCAINIRGDTNLTLSELVGEPQFSLYRSSSSSPTPCLMPHLFFCHIPQWRSRASQTSTRGSASEMCEIYGVACHVSCWVVKPALASPPNMAVKSDFPLSPEDPPPRHRHAMGIATVSQQKTKKSNNKKIKKVRSLILL